MSRRKCFLTMIAAFAGTSLWAAAQASPDVSEQNRARIAELHNQPARLAKLHDNLKAFLELPESRQTAITNLERQLSALPADQREQYSQTLGRYADWLEQLRKKDPQAYQAIKEAPNSATRLRLITERRNREWMEEQPIKYREQWEKLTGAARSEFVAARRADERHRQAQFQIARRFWKELETGKSMPSRLSDFADGKTDKVKKYVEDYLLPYLSPEEKKQLEAAEGRWPDYPQALVAIASKRPSALPPDPPRKFAQLPVPVQQRLSEKKKDFGKKNPLIEIKQFEGPVFASKVVAIALRDGKLPFAHEYLASNDKALSLPMRDFVENKLMPALKDQGEKRQLTDSLGKWPEYPQTIQELAKKHNMTPPWHILPDAEKWKWDYYRHSRARSWGAEIVKDKK